MIGLAPKHPRIRLAKADYRRLCREVWNRDRWRCQICGAFQSAARPPSTVSEFARRRATRKPSNFVCPLPQAISRHAVIETYVRSDFSPGIRPDESLDF